MIVQSIGKYDWDTLMLEQCWDVNGHGKWTILAQSSSSTSY